MLLLLARDWRRLPPASPPPAARSPNERRPSGTSLVLRWCLQPGPAAPASALAPTALAVLAKPFGAPAGAGALPG
jgi:hypothetical protein